ncbi:MAG: hypothetical protein Athens041674_354 [Parcubacteria group bacterium Athens0416_74]|nr:MAG: hypothetical protein Athens041674_354 [Parcubacteria group bacterium Athens0416_74]
MRFIEPIDTKNLASRIAAEGAVVVPGALSSDTVEELVRLAELERWHKAESIVGTSQVEQDYFVVEAFHRESVFRLLAEKTSSWVNTWGSLTTGWSWLRFNETRLQRYDTNSRGISPHRDGLRYRQIIALYVLEGGGRFGLCDDRTESKQPVNARVLQMSAGDLVLMRAAGFLGEDIQPMHFVDGVQERRITYGLRYVP